MASSSSSSFIEIATDCEDTDTDTEVTEITEAEATVPTESTDKVLSLLDKLKSPSSAAIARKREVKVNQPPKGKRRCRGNLVSDPKKVSPSQRVKEFSSEPFNVINKHLFCKACREQLSLKRSVIINHVHSTKHLNSKKKCQVRNEKQMGIVEQLKKYNEEVHMQGETLPDAQQAYRVRVVIGFLRAGIPLHKIEPLRDLLEEGGYRLTDNRHMHDYLPFIRKQEEEAIKQEICGKSLSVIFDGTTRLGEALAILVRFVGEDWSLNQRLIRVQMLSKSLTGEEIASELINVMSVAYGIHSKYLLGAMRDRASTNNVAMRTLKIVYPSLVDIGCFSHTIDHVGNKFVTPVLTEFISAWISLFSHSPKAKWFWKSRNGRAMQGYSATRWWSKWEVINQVMVCFGDIEPFLDENDDIGPNLRPKLLKILKDPQGKALLEIEIAATVDFGEPFVKACYFLEGDGPLALVCYEQIEKVKASMQAGHLPNVRAIATRLSGKPPADPLHEQFVTYAKNCVQPGLSYFNLQLSTSLKKSLEVFKAFQLFSPQKAYTMQPDASKIDQLLSCVPFLNNLETLDALKAELPTYLAKAAGTEENFCPLEWWKMNTSSLPQWSAAARKACLIQPSSAASERVFSLLKNSFNEQQQSCLQDYIESSLMMQYNSR